VSYPWLGRSHSPGEIEFDVVQRQEVHVQVFGRTDPQPGLDGNSGIRLRDGLGKAPGGHAGDQTSRPFDAGRTATPVQERQSTVIFGEGDTGKSWLATWMAVLVSMGMPRLGMEAEPGNVLYLDYETDEDTLLERVDMISSGLDIDIPDGIYYRQMHQLFAADFQQINKLVVDNNIALVIVDSAAPAVGEPESSAPTTEYFRALRSLRKSTLTIAHVSKAGKENEPFGSIFWRNLPRANFRVNASHEPGASQFVIGLKHTKSNNGRRLRDRAYEITFSEGAVTFDHAAITDFPDLAKGLSHGQRISAALHNGAKSVKELAETLEISEASVRTTLNRHKDELYAVTENAGGIIRWGNMHYGETP